MRAPTYAEATSTLALFIALGGVSWAATSLPKNSVSSAAIRDAQVRSADLAAGSVTANKLSKSLRAQLGVSANGKDGTSGADGTNGASGADGKSGANGTAGANGQNGAPGRDGAAIAAHAVIGDVDVSDTTFKKVGELSWSQPAGALDDIRGVYTVLKNAYCNNGVGGAAYRIMVDDQEISYDWGNTAADNDSANDPDALITPPWSGYQGNTDRGVFGGEIPVTGGSQPTTHKLELYLRKKACTSPVQLRGIELYVTRFLPAS